MAVRAGREQLAVQRRAIVGIAELDGALCEQLRARSVIGDAELAVLRDDRQPRTGSVLAPASQRSVDDPMIPSHIRAAAH